MVDDYYSRGARLSSNSWGADVQGAYDATSQEYDLLVRDALQSMVENQELLFIFAAGNAGPDASTLGSPGTAKNVLTVGASETSSPDAAHTDGCGHDAADGDAAHDMARFSSRGPARDGRIKPDIVAPGTFIQGAASQPDFTGTSVCGAASNDMSAPGDDARFPPGSLYTWSSGTSHATPAVAGYAALVHAFLDRVYGLTNISPALVKGYVIHSGRHLAGNGADDDFPSNNQGFGLANMGFGFDTTAPRFFHDQATRFGASGETVTFEGAIADPNEPVRVTLVWTDAPGPTFGDAFVNDLNLVVNVGGATYLGNNFSGGISQPGGNADFHNNVESVFLPPGHSGSATITVDAMTIAGDGVPGNADTTDQDFAVVAYNFVPAAPAGTVALDRDNYRCDDRATVTVVDTDLRNLSTLTVAAASTTGDSETVSLSAATAGSGRFIGTLATDRRADHTPDGVIDVDHGTSLTVTYEDADNGTGVPVTMQDTAQVDCVSPVISDVATIAAFGTAATVTFVTDEPTTVQVRIGTACASLTQTQPSVDIATGHRIELTDLMPSSDYFFVVDATDRAGNRHTDDNSGACYTFTTSAAPVAESIIPERNPIATGSLEGVLIAATGLTVDFDGNIYVADTQNHVIRKYSPAGEPLTVFGRESRSGTVDGPPVDVRFALPTSLATAPDGNIVVADGGIAEGVITHSGALLRHIDVNTLVTTTLADLSTDVDGSRVFDVFSGSVDDLGTLRALEIGDVAVHPNGDIFVSATDVPSARVAQYLVRIRGVEKRVMAHTSTPPPQDALQRTGTRGVAIDRRGDVFIPFTDRLLGEADSVYQFPAGDIVGVKQHFNVGGGGVIRAMGAGLGDRLYLSLRDPSGEIPVIAATRRNTLLGTLGVMPIDPQFPDARVQDIAVGRQGNVYTVSYRLVQAGSATTYLAKVDRFAGIDARIGTQAGDSIPPAVTITAPGNGQRIDAPTTIRASAEDNSGQVQLQFRLDDKPFGPLRTAPPFELVLDPELIFSGRHLLYAVAHDLAGNAQVSPIVSLQSVGGLPNRDGEIFLPDRELSAPFGITTDQDSNVYVADTTLIGKYSPMGDLLRVFGQFNQLSGMGNDAAGNILILDRNAASFPPNLPRVHRLNPTTEFLTTLVLRQISFYTFTKARLT